MDKNLDSVKEFWNENPLFTGESKFDEGSLEFFEDHKKVYYEDVFADDFRKEKYMPKFKATDKVLDLGCGVGFWTIEMLQYSNTDNFHSADLTPKALEITEKRLKLYNLKSELSLQNAEKMTFEDGTFDHLNCQGVIHHTPDTQACLNEIARVIKPGGTASISVYYRNFILRNWKYIAGIGGRLAKIGGGLKGRGREKIFTVSDVNEITRLYDGEKNPVGKSYSRKQILDMVPADMEVENVFLNFFPARSLPFKVPKGLHKFLSRNMGFMIHITLRKNK